LRVANRARAVLALPPMKQVLLTGFEPFGGEALNSSAEVARELHGATLARHHLTSVLLPCVFGAALKELKLQLKLVAPAIVICLGQAGNRAAITPERVALNLDDARIADNAGQQPLDRPVVKGAPAAYFSTLPIKAIVHELRAAGIPAALSATAGSFVCNHVFYGLLHRLARHAPTVRGGFIHLPRLPEQAAPGEPSMTLETMTRGIRLAVEAAVTYRRDVKRPFGHES